jgi:hypothetical protein
VCWVAGGGSRCIGSRRGVGASLLLLLLLCYARRQCGLDLIDDTDGYCNRSIRLILLCNLNCASAYVMNCLFSSHPNFSFRFPLSLSPSGEEILDGENMYTCLKCKEKRKCTKKLSIFKYPRVLVRVEHTSTIIVIQSSLFPLYYFTSQLLSLPNTYMINLFGVI